MVIHHFFTTFKFTVMNLVKPFWKSASFFASLFVLTFSAWAGFNTETGDAITNATLAISGAVFALRKLVSESKIDLAKWIGSGNTWIYLSAVLSAVFGDWVTGLLPQLQDVVEAITAKNFSAVISAGIAFLISVFYLVRDRAGKQIAAALKNLPAHE